MPSPKQILLLKIGPQLDNYPSKKDSFSGFTHPLSQLRWLLGISKFWPDLAKSKTGPTFENRTWEGGALPQ